MAGSACTTDPGYAREMWQALAASGGRRGLGAADVSLREGKPLSCQCGADGWGGWVGRTWQGPQAETRAIVACGRASAGKNGRWRYGLPAWAYEHVHLLH
mgnify:CR=1 FL=1